MRLPTPPTSITAVEPDSADYDSTDDESHSQLELQRRMHALTLHSEFPRYLGKSSKLRFFKQAYDLKHSYAGLEAPGTSMLNERVRLSLNRAKYIRSQPVSYFVAMSNFSLLIICLQWFLSSFDPPPVPNGRRIHRHGAHTHQS